MSISGVAGNLAVMQAMKKYQQNKAPVSAPSKKAEIAVSQAPPRAIAKLDVPDISMDMKRSTFRAIG